MAWYKIAQWAIPFLLLDVGHAAKTLTPIRPSGGRHSKRQAMSEMDLKSSETLLWADGEDNVAVANLTLYMPDDAEGILNMERFDSMLKTVECNDDSIAMTFQDEASFSYAQRVWDWVNGAENNSFVMVAGVGDCGNNTRRIPYVVSQLDYNEADNQAILTANQSDWITVAHSYDLTVGSVAQDPVTGAGLRARDIDKSTSVDFNHDLAFSFALGTGPVEARIACLNCSSTGSFDMEFKVSQKLLVPTGASMKISPKGVSAIAQVKLSGSGSITDALVKEVNILEIPISGLKIPGILDLGPFLTVALGAELSAITITAGVTTGAMGKISDEAILEVDLLNPEKNTFSGWDPEVEQLDTTIDASIAGGVAVFLKPFLNLQAEALGKGFAIGLNMKIPNINARIAAIASPTGACPAVEGQARTTLGVNLSANIGGSLNIEAKRTDDSDPLFTVQIAAIDKPFASKCFPFGDEIAARSLSRNPHYRGIAAV